MANQQGAVLWQSLEEEGSKDAILTHMIIILLIALLK